MAKNSGKDFFENMLKNLIEPKEETTDDLIDKFMNYSMRFMSGVPNVPSGPYTLTDKSEQKIDKVKSIFDLWVEIICENSSNEYHAFIYFNNSKKKAEAVIYRDLTDGTVELLYPAEGKFIYHPAIYYIRQHEKENDSFWQVLEQYADYKELCPYSVKNHVTLEIMENNKEIIALYEALGNTQVKLKLLPNDDDSDWSKTQYVIAPLDKYLYGSIILWKNGQYMLANALPEDDLIIVREIVALPNSDSVLNFIKFFMQATPPESFDAKFAIPISKDALVYVGTANNINDMFHVAYYDKERELSDEEEMQLNFVKSKIEDCFDTDDELEFKEDELEDKGIFVTAIPDFDEIDEE